VKLIVQADAHDVEKAIPSQYAVEYAFKGQSSHISDHLLVLRETASAQRDQRGRSVDPGDLQAAPNQIGGDWHTPAASEVENFGAYWQLIGKTQVPTFVVPITFAAVGIPIDRTALVVTNDFVGKVRHLLEVADLLSQSLSGGRIS
jgi:hypothetical protein